MRNRFNKNLLLLLFIFAAFDLFGQANFQFSYTGSDTLFVDDNCQVALLWGDPQTVSATCTYPNADSCSIAQLGIIEISDNYQVGDPITAGNTVTITYEATTDSNEVETFSFDLEIVDTIPPTFNLPADVTINCGQSIDPSLTGFISAVGDNCNGPLDTIYTDIFEAGSCVQQFSIIREWRVVDVHGNSSSIAQQRIAIRDQTTPNFIRNPRDQVVDCSGSDIEVLFANWLNDRGNAFARDNCTPDNELTWFAALPGTYSLNDPLTFPGIAPGLLDTVSCPGLSGIFRLREVDFVVVDECNNASVQTATFTVEDHNDPIFITCPQDTILTLDRDSCDSFFTLVEPSLQDDCDDGISLFYRINNASSQPFLPGSDNIVSLSSGENFIDYVAVDCARNESTCSIKVTVWDTQLPDLICPADTIIYLTDSTDCDLGLAFTIPLPTVITDNCPLDLFEQTQPTDQQLSLLTFSYDRAADEYIADDKEVRFLGTAADAVGDFVQLTLTLMGNVTETEAYFEIFGEDGNSLGTTAVGQSNVVTTNEDCMTQPITPGTNTTIINISSTLYNGWAADGAVDFSFVSNRSFTNSNAVDEGINPVCTDFTPGTLDNTPDGISRLSAFLSYERTQPRYSVSGATIISEQNTRTPVINPTHFFLPGVSNVQYTVTDIAGNENSCSFEVNTFDTIAPTIVCKNATIFVNPSGLQAYLLQVDEINDGSTDNCSLDSLYLSQNTFICNQSGTQQTVFLFGRDAAGNIDSCQALIQIETEPPQPTFSVGLCGNDTLFLFANPPAGGPYSYNWTGPGGFSSIEGNPILPGANIANAGVYTVTLEGGTGCSVQASVTVTINANPNKPILMVADTLVCANDTIRLSTDNFQGNQLQYLWYRGVAPTGIFIASTSNPFLNLAPPISTDDFYVVVSIDGCQSNPSESVNVNVVPVPVASTRFPLIEVCEGSSFVLETTINDPAFNYIWTGPNGYRSEGIRTPLVDKVSLSDSGQYFLVVEQNGCRSDVASTLVNVRDQPDQPSLSSGSVVCEGDTLRLTTDNITGAIYTWTGPDSSTRLSLINELVLPNAQVANSGNWSVVVIKDGCSSVPSSPIDIFISPLPVAEIMTNAPFCVDDTIRLSATEVLDADYEWTGPSSFRASGKNVQTVVNNGTYQLRVTNNLGCSNTEGENVQIVTAPVITAVSNSASDCVFEEDSVRLVATVFPADPGDYTYHWTGPGNYVSLSENPVLPSDTIVFGELYHLIVSDQNGCESAMSTIIIDAVLAPEQPSIDGTSVVCSDGAILLSTSAYNASQVLYIWNTPLGIDTTFIPSLVISPAGFANAGNYSVTVQTDSCQSMISDNFLVEVTNRLSLPVVSSNSPVCSGDSIRLLTTIIADAIYSWTGSNGFNSMEANPVIPNASVDQAGAYAVRIELDGCSSDFSIPEIVMVNPVPTTPEIDNNGPVCISETGAQVELSIVNVSSPDDTRYTWYDADDTRVGGPTRSLNFTLNNFAAYGEGTFDFYVVATVDGCDSEPSVATSVEMNTFPDIVADAGDDTQLCEADRIDLNANQPSTGTGRWVQLSPNDPTNIIQEDNPSTAVEGLNPGNTYTFQWLLSNGVCIDYSADEVVVQVNTNDDIADAGFDQVNCGDDLLMLDAFPSMNGNGRWLAFDNNTTVLFPDSATSPVTINTDGQYFFEWTIDNGDCGITKDTVTITYESAYVAIDDAFEVEFERRNEVNVLSNDSFGDDYTINLKTATTNGSIVYDSDGIFRYIPDDGFSGQDLFEYFLCHQTCPDTCDSAVVILTITKELPCTVPTIFTPNQDGINDAFVIPCLDTGTFTGTKVSIFTQWGEEVYRSDNYENDWRGIYKGEDLPAGTYFYHVDFGNGQELESGFLVLER